MLDIKSVNGSIRNGNVRCPHCGNYNIQSIYEVENSPVSIRPNHLGNSLHITPYLCGECGMMFINRQTLNQLKDYPVAKAYL